MQLISKTNHLHHPCTYKYEDGRFFFPWFRSRHCMDYHSKPVQCSIHETMIDFCGLRRYIRCMTSLGLKTNTSEIFYSWNEHHLVNDN